MSIDWDEFERDLDGIIDKAANKTDESLATKISSITRMTDEEVIELFPNPADVKKLAKLMQIVKSGEERNNKVNKIVDNSEELAGVILSILTKLA